MSKLKQYSVFAIVAMIVVSCLLVVVGVYLVKFGGRPFSNSPADWGVFGDYIGGTLNSLFSFFSFLALLYTIHLQQKELALTRAELHASTKAQTESSIFAGKQNEITIQQLITAQNNEKKNDIYNLIKLVDEKIKNALSVKVDDLRVDGIEQVFFDFIFEVELYLNNVIPGDKYHRKIKIIKNDLDNISSEISYLFKAIEEFELLSESKVISEYYLTVTPYPRVCEIIKSINAREDLW